MTSEHHSRLYWGAKDTRHGTNRYWAIGTFPLYVQCHGVKKEDIVPLDVTLHPDQSIPERPSTDSDYWGWMTSGEEHYSLIQPTYLQFWMQFPYGWQAEAEKGKGMAYRLEIKLKKNQSQ
jgi:hypothetical protein